MGTKCSGLNCPMQYGINVEACDITETCSYFTPKITLSEEEIPTPEEAREHILCLQKIDSTPERHIAMDDYLMAILEKLGYKEAVDAFNNTDKWYA